jgi:hypothetical protein
MNLVGGCGGKPGGGAPGGDSIEPSNPEGLKFILLLFGPAPVLMIGGIPGGAGGGAPGGDCAIDG